MKIYYIKYIAYYQYYDSNLPVYEILNNIYFKSVEDVKKYIEQNIKLKNNEYSIESLNLYDEAEESVSLF